MHSPRHAGPRCLLIEVAATGLAAALLRLLAGSLRQPGGSGPARALTLLCVAALVGCVCWAWLATTAVVLEALLSPTTRGTGAPGASGAGVLPGVVPVAWRRLVLLACGVVVAAGVAVPAHATPGSVQLDPTGRIDDTALRGLPLPDRATQPAVRARSALPQPTGSVAPVAPVAPGATVVVRAGDTLWSLARADLTGGDVSDPAVDAHWRAVHQLNRAVIGADPDVIVPGQRLLLPAPGTND